MCEPGLPSTTAPGARSLTPASLPTQLYSHTLPNGETFNFTHTYNDTLLAQRRRADVEAARQIFSTMLASGVRFPEMIDMHGDLFRGQRDEVLRMVRQFWEMVVGLMGTLGWDVETAGRAVLMGLNGETEEEESAEEDGGSLSDSGQGNGRAEEEDDLDEWFISDEDDERPPPVVHRLPYTLDHYQRAAAAGVRPSDLPVHSGGEGAPDSTPLSPTIRRPLHPRALVLPHLPHLPPRPNDDADENEGGEEGNEDDSEDDLIPPLVDSDSDNPNRMTGLPPLSENNVRATTTLDSEAVERRSRGEAAAQAAEGRARRVVEERWEE